MDNHRRHLNNHRRRANHNNNHLQYDHIHQLQNDANEKLELINLNTQTIPPNWTRFDTIANNQQTSSSSCSSNATDSIAATTSTCSLASSAPTQRIINCSPSEAAQRKQLARVIKWLCATIFALVLVVLALILFDGPSHLSTGYRGSRAQKFIERLSPSSAGLEQGRLLAAGSDNHLYINSMPDIEDSDTGSGGDHDASSQDHHDEHHVEPNQVMAPPSPGRLGFSGRRSKIQRDQPDNICMSTGCIRASAQILNNMDNKTRPCDDFYQFACGRWIETQLIPDEKTSLSVFSQNTADLNIKLRSLIERRPSERDPPIVGQMRNMYASCMNTTDIETRGDEPLLEVLRDLGGWPVVGNEPAGSARSTGNVVRRSTPEGQPGNKFNWLDTIIKFRQRGFSHDMIIDLSVVPDVRNSRRYIIELDQSSLGLPDRSYYFKGMEDTTVGAYYKLMVESAVMLGANRQVASKQMLEALEFETSLAKISVPREQRRNVTRLYNKMLAKDLYSLAPNIDWLRYLRSLLKDDQLDLERDEVIVKVPNFIRAIDQLLADTEPRVVANYMIWRIVRHSMSGLSRRWRELAHSYSTITTGRQVEEPRWEQCLGSLDGTLGTALSAMYVKNHFNGQSKAAALEMVDYIRGEFLRILDEIDWMDEETRAEAKLKARGIAAYIGYPDELLKDELVEELYEGVRMSRTNFYQNVRNLRIWSTDYAFSQLRRPNKRGDWKKHARAAVVNAYYNSLENSIEFPAGILQGAFFDAERPNYMNFGAIGYVIGHEITHGFDDRGRQFDRDGNDRNWWKAKTDARFRERAQCIIEQYGNYTVNNDTANTGGPLRVNGMNTQGENIADNGGIKEAFRAYRRWTKDHGREARLPGLAEYSPEQLFWISAANIWCGKFRPEVLKLRVNSGVHSPARFRIIGPLSNSADFARSFNCPSGSPMNPAKKCSVW